MYPSRPIITRQAIDYKPVCVGFAAYGILYLCHNPAIVRLILEGNVGILRDIFIFYIQGITL